MGNKFSKVVCCTGNEEPNASETHQSVDSSNVTLSNVTPFTPANHQSDPTTNATKNKKGKGKATTPTIDPALDEIFVLMETLIDKCTKEMLHEGVERSKFQGKADVDVMKLSGMRYEAQPEEVKAQKRPKKLTKKDHFVLNYLNAGKPKERLTQDELQKHRQFASDLDRRKVELAMRFYDDHESVPELLTMLNGLADIIREEYAGDAAVQERLESTMGPMRFLEHEYEGYAMKKAEIMDGTS